LHFSHAGQTAAVKFLVLLCLPAFALALPACSLFKSNKPDSAENKPAAEGPELIGRIASIPADKHFVLIQSYGSWNIEAGTILTTRGLEERTSNLLVTGEKLGQFAAADIQSGSVEIGDAVYSQHVPKPAETTAATDKEPELPENQQKEEIENVQKNN
jgi:hypothetical protein